MTAHPRGACWSGVVVLVKKKKKRGNSSGRFPKICCLSETMGPRLAGQCGLSEKGVENPPHSQASLTKMGFQDTLVFLVYFGGSSQHNRYMLVGRVQVELSVCICCIIDFSALLFFCRKGMNSETKDYFCSVLL
jgi:hypothetical protein